jgi:hypothetical protein
MTTDLLNKIAGTHLPDDNYDNNGISKRQAALPGKLKKGQNFPEKERTIIESEIVDSVQAYVVSSMDIPKEEQKIWWKRFIAF